MEIEKEKIDEIEPPVVETDAPKKRGRKSGTPNGASKKPVTAEIISGELISAISKKISERFNKPSLFFSVDSASKISRSFTDLIDDFDIRVDNRIVKFLKFFNAVATEILKK